MATLSGEIAPIMIPVEVQAPFMLGITPEQLSVRLKEGGTLRFRGGSFEIKGGGFSQNTYTFWACDSLELEDTKITTNGNTLIIFCNRLSSKNSTIVAFDAPQRKAALGASATSPGGHGLPGAPGDDGGLVSIHVIQTMEGTINVDLTAQSGGDGGNAADGNQGLPGVPGEDSESKFTVKGFPPTPRWSCSKEAGRGGQGGTGGPGGVGGSAGNGGSGGILELFNVGSQPLPEASHSFVGLAGQPGKPGRGGIGGPGGPGGRGGAGSLWCHGGFAGSDGERGSSGKDGEPGIQGADGRLVAENLDLEIILRR